MIQSDRIICRSRRGSECYHGRLITDIYSDKWDYENDGTFDGESVVCDACYMLLGSPGVPVKHPEAGEFGRKLEGGKG